MKYLQQGDVLLKPINKATGEKKNTNVLQEGEHTGHAHRITKGEFEIFVEAEKIYLKAITECLLTHEEHNPIEIAPGDYEIDIVREYEHFSEEARRVRD